jgi:hypothetical protein
LKGGLDCPSFHLKTKAFKKRLSIVIVLKEIGTAQTVRFIPTRRSSGTSLILKNETTNASTTYSITTSATSYYSTFSKILILKEGNFYEMTILDGAELVYRDKVFCTNQTIATYSINKDEYVENNQNIIFYE